jgi:beta-glucosidase
VRGYQGTNLAAPTALAACAKHFCAYGAVTAGREYAAVDISERSLHEVHLPGFVAAVEAGVATIMPAFTDLNGIPMTAHVPLLRDYLRGTLGWEGVLVSDYNAIRELIHHGVAGDIVDAAVLALKAGVDIDMMADAYRKGLPVALQQGRVTMAEIDTCVRRVLTLKERLGLFDDPYHRGMQQETPEVIAERRDFSRQVAVKSVVMLKNANHTLPLNPAVKRLAVLGPLADAAEEMKGPWWGAGGEEPHITVLAGLRSALPQAEIVHAEGVAITAPETGGIAEALRLCNDADAVILCLGERATMSGEAASRAYPELPGKQLELAKAVIERAKAQRIPVIAILFSGRPLVIPWLAENADAVLAAWFLGVMAGDALADLLLGNTSPSGRTPMTWPRAIGQVPIFFGQRPSGRPMNPDDFFTSKYQDVSNDPLYPFGHGLSYGDFSYAGLRVTPEAAGESGRFEISVEVSNGGRHEAEETVFLFTRDPVASVTRPLLELRGFGKIRLQPGATGTVRLSLVAAELRFLGQDLQPVFEAGAIEILVGPSADRKQLLSKTVQLR